MKMSRPEVKEEVKRSLSMTVTCLSRPEVKEEVKRSISLTVRCL